MGQYYRNCILKKNWKTAEQPIMATLNPFKFNNGAKLMEFSYIGNGLMRRVEYMLANEFKGFPFVCVGDYADSKPTKYYPIDNALGDGGVKLYCSAIDFEDTKRCAKIVDALPKWEYRNCYVTIPYYAYAVNYTKKEFVRLPRFNKNKWQVHPISLLCNDGNGQGCGDYYEEDGSEFVGVWAYDKIGVTNDKKEIRGFKELKVKFKV